MPRGPKGERPPPISAVAALTVSCPLAGPRSTPRPVKAEVVKMRLDPKWPLRCQSTAESIQRLLSAGVPPRGISVERRSGYASIRHRHFCKEWSSSARYTTALAPARASANLSHERTIDFDAIRRKLLQAGE
jgi:hypothetical protein